ncbi:MAG: 30S ribosomal protein S28e [Candidatus Micrarchaeota archaeon]
MDDAVPGLVVDVITKTGSYGEIWQVMVKVLDGRDKGRIMRRNVKGPVQVDDILMLIDTESEAKPIRGR